MSTTSATDDERWTAVLRRDGARDSDFVFAVRTTGVYCRPSCSSRRPNRQNVLFFGLPEVAAEAGFRPCKRCHPNDVERPDPQLELARQMCHHIHAHADEPLTLEALGTQFGYSAAHLQRTFKSVVGISPQSYQDAIRLHQLRQALRAGDGISGATYDAGFGSISRVYERASAQLGMTPGAYQRGGAGASIRYSIVASPLGRLLVAATQRGICAVRLGDDDMHLERELLAEFNGAQILHDDHVHRDWVEAIVRHLEGKQPHLDLPRDVQGTAFQKQVWDALTQIPYGQTRSYAAIAQAIGRPSAVRAVANACAHNPTALVVPCHRVVRNDGALGGYRWGEGRKRALLEREAVGREP